MPKKYSARKIRKQENSMWRERETELGKNPYKHSKNYIRREFLKTGAKVGGSAAVYGTVGGFLGKGYETIRDLYNAVIKKGGTYLSEQETKAEISKEKPNKGLGDRFRELSQRLGRFKYDTQGKVEEKVGIGRDEKQKQEWRYNKEIPNPKTGKPEERPIETTRRGFFRTILGYAHQHPVGTGIAAGAAYGAGKSAYRQRRKARDKIEIAELKDKVNYLEDKINPKESEEVKEAGLEKTLTIIGIIGVFISIFFSLSNITGLAILDMSTQKTKISSIIILIISLILIIVGKIKFKN